MKKIFVLITFFQLSIVIAQENAFTSDVNNRNGLLYLNNKLFTGVLYSDDDVEIPNECLCTLKANYSNGELNGVKKEWYKTGKQKYLGKYRNGNKEGEHKSFYSDGRIKGSITYLNNQKTKEKEYYPNGNLHYEVNYKNGIEHGIHKEFSENNMLLNKIEFVNGKLKKQETYNNFGIKEEKIINDNIEEISFYTDSGSKQKVEFYSLPNREKHGIWLIFDKEGEKIEEIEYEKGRKIRVGKYLNDQKTGIWHFYSKYGDTETIKEFLNDKEISSKTLVYGKLISRNLPKENEQLISHIDGFDYTKKYYILRFLFDDSDNNVVEIKRIINHLLHTRTSHIYDIQSVENNELSGVIEISNIGVDYKESIYERTKTENGKKVPYKEKGYDAIIKYDVRVIDIERHDVFNHSFSINKSGKLLNSIFNNALGAYSKNKTDAFNSSLKHIHLVKLFVRYFPIKGRITSIAKENKSSVSQIEIDRGSAHKVKKKMTFYVFDNDNQKYRAKLQVIKVNSNTSICKVMNEKKWLKKYIPNNEKILIEETN